MTMVTRLNGSTVMLDAELIEFLESAPDTPISLTSGNQVHLRGESRQFLDKMPRSFTTTRKGGA